MAKEGVNWISMAEHIRIFIDGGGSWRHYLEMIDESNIHPLNRVEKKVLERIADRGDVGALSDMMIFCFAEKLHHWWNLPSVQKEMAD